ncbi:hypothetical protein ElyMa_002672000 [Elysia marginata]|uniref:Uncharacterized protein n=1 Tax=Elysia marginata TaxID=1093978 RepID=A0AAV4H8Z4_9GAST|nr:hypothetical protein ElyMa_002672000 [Elysia marginata]
MKSIYIALSSIGPRGIQCKTHKKYSRYFYRLQDKISYMYSTGVSRRDEISDNNNGDDDDDDDDEDDIQEYPPMRALGPSMILEFSIRTTLRGLRHWI